MILIFISTNFVCAKTQNPIHPVGFLVNCNSPDVDQIAAEWIQYLVRAAESPRVCSALIYEGYNFLPFIRSYIFLQYDYIRLCLEKESP